MSTPGWGVPSLYRNSYIYNVRDFGAAGDGTTDDTVAINAAVSAANAAPAGSTVFFPPGTYLISKPLVLTRAIRLAGVGQPETNSGLTAIVVANASIDCIVAYNMSNFGIFGLNLAVNSGASGQGGRGIVLLSVQGADIEQVGLAGFTSGMLVQKSGGVNIFQCTFNPGAWNNIPTVANPTFTTVSGTVTVGSTTMVVSSVGNIAVNDWLTVSNGNYLGVTNSNSTNVEYVQVQSINSGTKTITIVGTFQYAHVSGDTVEDQTRFGYKATGTALVVNGASVGGNSNDCRLRNCHVDQSGQGSSYYRTLDAYVMAQGYNSMNLNICGSSYVNNGVLVTDEGTGSSPQFFICGPADVEFSNCGFFLEACGIAKLTDCQVDSGVLAPGSNPVSYGFVFGASCFGAVSAESCWVGQSGPYLAAFFVAPTSSSAQQAFINLVNCQSIGSGSTGLLVSASGMVQLYLTISNFLIESQSPTTTGVEVNCSNSFNLITVSNTNIGLYNSSGGAAGTGYSLGAMLAGSFSATGGIVAAALGVAVTAGSSAIFTFGDIDFWNCTVGISDSGASAFRVFRGCGGVNLSHMIGSPPPVPSVSGGSQYNSTGFDCTVYPSGGTAVSYIINGVSVPTPFRLNAGSVVVVTYSTTPSWVWQSI